MHTNSNSTYKRFFIYSVRSAQCSVFLSRSLAKLHMKYIKFAHANIWLLYFNFKKYCIFVFRLNRSVTLSVFFFPWFIQCSEGRQFGAFALTNSLVISLNVWFFLLFFHYSSFYRSDGLSSIQWIRFCFALCCFASSHLININIAYECKWNNLWILIKIGALLKWRRLQFN